MLSKVSTESVVPLEHKRCVVLALTLPHKPQPVPLGTNTSGKQSHDFAAAPIAWHLNWFEARGAPQAEVNGSKLEVTYASAAIKIDPSSDPPRRISLGPVANGVQQTGVHAVSASENYACTRSIRIRSQRCRSPCRISLGLLVDGVQQTGVHEVGASERHCVAHEPVDFLSAVGVNAHAHFAEYRLAPRGQGSRVGGIYQEVLLKPVRRGKWGRGG